AILHDPETYPDPDVFRPERHMPDKFGNVQKDPVLMGTFGFGRRICAGKNLGDATVWLAIATLLAVFDISYALDKNGEKIDVTDALDPVGTVLCEPAPFVCKIQPRSEKAEKLVRMTYVMAQE
ncbi:hypothetical protein M422DRAFT_195351, partial [Sphaerobolus stellatus SS14]